MKKQTKILIIIISVVAVILLGSLIGYNVYRDQKEKAYENETRQKLQDAIVVGSEELGITDIEVVSIEKVLDENGNYKGHETTNATSEMFGELNNEGKVQYFIRVHQNADVSIRHFIECRKILVGETPYGGLHITSQGHEYMFRFENATTVILYRDGKEFYEYKFTGNGPRPGDKMMETCDHCDGRGVTDHAYHPTTCPKCDGKGYVITGY